MQLNNLIPKTKNKKIMIVGRGGRRGKTSGRGGKGQTARAGNKRRPELRDFIKRIPKLRGRGVNLHKSIEEISTVVNIDAIEKSFKSGDIVSPESLIEKKVISTFNGNIPRVKILGNGNISIKISLQGCEFSKQAKIKIEKALGSVKV